MGRLILIPAALGLAGGMPTDIAQAQTPGIQPNIVFYYADDMGLGDTTAYQDLTGNPDALQIDTPNIQRLANMGTRFTDVHTTSAVCSPSRTGLLTGAYAYRSPLKIGNLSHALSKLSGQLNGQKTMMAMLQDSGYRTYGVGKWHIGLQQNDTTGELYESPIQHGFDRYTGTPGNFASNTFMIQDNQEVRFNAAGDLVPRNDPTALPWANTSPNPQDDQTNTLKIQQKNLDTAQEYLADHQTHFNDQPFFLYYASHANHVPYVSPDTLEGHPLNTDLNVTVAGDKINVSVIPDNNGDGIPEINDPNYNAIKPDKWDDYYQGDAAGTNIITNGPTERAQMVKENDIIMGELLDYLETTPDPRNPGQMLIANTMIVFTSDNGSDMGGEPDVGALPQESDGVITDLRGKKANIWEGGTRVPFIAAWAGQINQGDTSNALFGQTDMYATLAEAAGYTLQADEAADSISVLSAIKAGGNIGAGDGDPADNGVVRSEDMIYKYRNNFVIRRGDYKLIAKDTDFNGDGQDAYQTGIDGVNLTTTGFYDLSVDLGETTDLKNNPGLQALIADMRNNLEQISAQGFTRAGANAVDTTYVQFQGTDFNAAVNWFSYDVAENGSLPTISVQGYVYIDGDITASPDGMRVYHRNGTLDFTSANVNNTEFRNSDWTIEGGTLVTSSDTAAVKLEDTTLRLKSGLIDLPVSQVRLHLGDSLLEITGGALNAKLIDAAKLNGSTPGAKVIRFGLGDGVVTLTDPNPIRFGIKDGDTTDDFLDFITGSLGQLVTPANSAYFQSLWDTGDLRVDGVTGLGLGITSFTDLFDLLDNGNGTTTLSLTQLVALQGDLDGDGFVGINDLNIILGNWNQNVPPANPLADPSGDGFIGIDDLNTVLGNWNAGTPPIDGAAIPEPATLTLLGLGGLTLMRRKTLH